MWYEVAYHEVAQLGEACQYYERTLVEGGVAEKFGFTYPKLDSKQGTMNMFFTSSNETGLFDKYMDYPLVRKIKFPSVVIDFTVDAKGEYSTLTEYLCYNIGGVSYEEVTVGSRQPTISTVSLASIKAMLIAKGIVVPLKEVNQTGCSYGQ